MKPTVIILGLLFAISSVAQKANLSIEESIENQLIPKYKWLVDTNLNYSLAERMLHYHVPGISIVIIKNGQVVMTKAYGQRNTTLKELVNDSTLFQAGSISKTIAALGILRLYEAGIVDLDRDVNQYLKTWKISESSYLKREKVTLRRLLSHTAGVNGYWFEGYAQKDTLPSLNDVLSGKGNSEKIRVDTVPGTRFKYSGGGYAIIQKVIEEVTGKGFVQLMNDEVFVPLKMTNSTYGIPLPENLQRNVSAAFNHKGEMVEGLWYNYGILAAAGLWTTPTDLSKYLIEIQQIMAGKKEGILTKRTVKMMLKPVLGIPYGLGVSFTNSGDSLMFGHGGKNKGFINNMTAFVHFGEGYVMMTNGDNGGSLRREIENVISSKLGWGIGYETAQEIKLDTEILNGYQGRYALESDSTAILEVSTSGNLLRIVDVWEEKTYTHKFFPIKLNVFIGTQLARITFVKEGGKEYLDWKQGRTFRYRKKKY
jgi:CubicO group peptidase (beta-lactamase class C family)